MPHISRNDLTAAEVRRQVSYDHITGIFTRNFVEGASSKSNCWAGRVSGSINGSGYLRVSINGVSYKAHRLAWLHYYGEWPSNTIDHINGDRTDNRIANLRDVPHAQNQLNLKRHRAGKAPHPKIERKPKRVGSVIFMARLGKWMAQYKREYLGIFISKELAERAITERIEIGS